MKARYLLPLLFILGSLSIAAQTIKYSGIITDADNKSPLIGVTILVQDTDLGTLTDIDGRFELDAEVGQALLITYIGYADREIILGNQQEIDIALEPSSELIDEVVVIGYGTQKKSDLTGSIASVKSEDITSLPTANAMQALQGKVSGLQILSTSGDPGAAPVVRLRGVTTLNDTTPAQQ